MVGHDAVLSGRLAHSKAESGNSSVSILKLCQATLLILQIKAHWAYVLGLILENALQLEKGALCFWTHRGFLNLLVEHEKGMVWRHEVLKVKRVGFVGGQGFLVEVLVELGYSVVAKPL